MNSPTNKSKPVKQMSFNFMHDEKMGIKLAPRQLRELTDARSIAILTTTLSHYCKLICDFNSNNNSSNTNKAMSNKGSKTSRHSHKRSDTLQIMKSSHINFETGSNTNSNGSNSHRSIAAQKKRQRCYQKLKDSEEALR